MSYSVSAQFHISLIPQRWYNCNKYNIEQDKKVPIYQIEESEQDEMRPQLSFQHLANFRQTPNVIQSQGPKQKYGFGMGYAKKALNLAIQADKVDEFVNQLEYFIENVKVKLSDQENGVFIHIVHIGDPLQVQHKGRQPNRYKSCGEPLKKKGRYIRDISNIINKDNNENVGANQECKKRERHCKKCNQVGHYAPRCPNV